MRAEEAEEREDERRERALERDESCEDRDEESEERSVWMLVVVSYGPVHGVNGSVLSRLRILSWRSSRTGAGVASGMPLLVVIVVNVVSFSMNTVSPIDTRTVSPVDPKVGWLNPTCELCGTAMLECEQQRIDE